MRTLVAVALAFSQLALFMPSHAFAGTGGDEQPSGELDPYTFYNEPHPISSSLSYNSTQESASVSFVDDFGRLFTMQVDVRNGFVTIMGDEGPAGFGLLTPLEATGIGLIARSIGVNPSDYPEFACGPLCVGFIITVIGIGIDAGMDWWNNRTECQNQMHRDTVNSINDAAACANQPSYRNGDQQLCYYVYQVTTAASLTHCTGAMGYCSVTCRQTPG